MGIGTQNGIEPPPAPGKNRWRTEKMSCKTMKQNENEQNYKKPVHAGRGRETKWEIPVKRECKFASCVTAVSFLGGHTLRLTPYGHGLNLCSSQIYMKCAVKIPASPL